MDQKLRWNIDYRTKSGNPFGRPFKGLFKEAEKDVDDDDDDSVKRMTSSDLHHHTY